MVSELNANTQVLKKTRGSFSCMTGSIAVGHLFSALITLKMWQTGAGCGDRLARCPKSGKHCGWEKLEWII